MTVFRQWLLQSIMPLIFQQLIKSLINEYYFNGLCCSMCIPSYCFHALISSERLSGKWENSYPTSVGMEWDGFLIKLKQLLRR